MTKRCPISYLPLKENQLYSKEGLRQLHPKLEQLAPLPFNRQELMEEADSQKSKMSVPGQQAKLNAVLRVKLGKMNISNINGRFVLKLKHPHFPQLPENEDLTMKMGKAAGLSVAEHGMLYSNDNSLVFWMRRFDRKGWKNRIPVENFAQLHGKRRHQKYEASVEDLVSIINQYCTFPAIEKAIFFKRFLFNFITGNGDMHLNRYSLITESNITKLAPCYDLVNTSILYKTGDETALPLGGKKNDINVDLLLNYLGKKLLDLNDTIIQRTLHELANARAEFNHLIEQSFLRPSFQSAYHEILKDRFHRC